MKGNSIFLSTFYLIFFLIGFLTYKDYGIGIEEIFQRASGFYWLKYILNQIGFVELASLSNTKYTRVIFNQSRFTKSYRKLILWNCF